MALGVLLAFPLAVVRDDLGQGLDHDRVILGDMLGQGRRRDQEFRTRRMRGSKLESEPKLGFGLVQGLMGKAVKALALLLMLTRLLGHTHWGRLETGIVDVRDLARVAMLLERLGRVDHGLSGRGRLQRGTGGSRACSVLGLRDVPMTRKSSIGMDLRGVSSVVSGLI